jgi:hypothetical protein
MTHALSRGDVLVAPRGTSALTLRVGFDYHREGLGKVDTSPRVSALQGCSDRAARSNYLGV